LSSNGVVLTKTALRATTEEFRMKTLASVRSPRPGAPEDIVRLEQATLSADTHIINWRDGASIGGEMDKCVAAQQISIAHRRCSSHGTGLA